MQRNFENVQVGTATFCVPWCKNYTSAPSFRNKTRADLYWLDIKVNFFYTNFIDKIWSEEIYLNNIFCHCILREMCLSITVTTKKFRCLKLAYISEVILMDCILFLNLTESKLSHRLFLFPSFLSAIVSVAKFEGWFF